MLTLTYEYKANPTQEQITLIEHTLDICRKIYVAKFGILLYVNQRIGLILVSHLLTLVQSLPSTSC